MPVPPSPQSPAPDPFDTLGVPARFDLAPAELRAAYLARSRALHPDLAVDGDSDDASAALNQAKRILEDPETRAEAMLIRLGGPSKEMDRSLPATFLHEMMEIREQVEEAFASRDPQEVVKWEQWAEERRRGHIAEVGRWFKEVGDAGGAAGGDSNPLKAIRMELNMWRYVQRLIEQLSGAEGAL